MTPVELLQDLWATGARVQRLNDALTHCVAPVDLESLWSDLFSDPVERMSRLLGGLTTAPTATGADEETSSPGFPPVRPGPVDFPPVSSFRLPEGVGPFPERSARLPWSDPPDESGQPAAPGEAGGLRLRSDGASLLGILRQNLAAAPGPGWQPHQAISANPDRPAASEPAPPLGLDRRTVANRVSTTGAADGPGAAARPPAENLLAPSGPSDDSSAEWPSFPWREPEPDFDRESPSAAGPRYPSPRGGLQDDYRMPGKEFAPNAFGPGALETGPEKWGNALVMPASVTPGEEEARGRQPESTPVGALSPAQVEQVLDALDERWQHLLLRMYGP